MKRSKLGRELDKTMKHLRAAMDLFTEDVTRGTHIRPYDYNEYLSQAWRYLNLSLEQIAKDECE